MMGYVQSVTATLRFFHAGNLWPWLHMFKPLSMALLPRAYQIARDASQLMTPTLTSRICDILRNPESLSKDTLKDIPFHYNSALWQALIVIEDD